VRLRLLVGAAAVALWGTVAALAAQAPSGAAWLVRSLDQPGPHREQRGDILNTPVLPGSIAKALTLVAALESNAVGEQTTHLCRRVVTVDGHTYTCTHPVLARPLTAAEALAYSCNDFFLSLAPRLSRQAINAVRTHAGLPPLAQSTPLAAALVGLDGPRVPARALVDVMARLLAAGPLPAVAMRESTRRVLRDGLRGAAEYGTASAFADLGVAALAKTGTAPMPGGGWMGLVVALAPPALPTRGVVVVAPGAGGLDAASIAADLLRSARAGDPPLRVGRSRPDGTVRTETLGLDAYVAEVVTGEAPPTAGRAALEALAITARTYALANRGRHAGEGFDLCDTTHCQALRPAAATARQAAAATTGRVLLSHGRIASVYHSAWCGGHPERPSEVWPGAADDSTPPALDDACAGEVGWASELRAADLERAFAAAGMRGERLGDLRVTGRNRTGRVTRVHVEGWTPSELSGQEFRTLIGRHLGWQHVKSTLFELRRTASGYRLSGRGFGHGAGLCMLGATHRAARNATTASILAFYFPGLSVGAVPAAGTDVTLALPGEESGQRAAMLSLIQRARDDVARAAGVGADVGVRVTVHPTVESFGRVTGQPWYVAGATHGSNVELLPIVVLRRGGLLERVVRHEVAHAVLDRYLKGRPLWVREGAAAYFAAGPRARAVTTGAPCPMDEELRRPASAAAQREAYSRAEACFARRVRDGVSWREVR
jgi:stage II sporulation protein D